MAKSQAPFHTLSGSRMMKGPLQLIQTTFEKDRGGGRRKHIPHLTAHLKYKEQWLLQHGEVPPPTSQLFFIPHTSFPENM